jgi:hypothetical protein
MDNITLSLFGASQGHRFSALCFSLRELTPNGFVKLVIAFYEGVTIRKIFHENEWRFAAVDIIAALTGTDRPSKYWSDLKAKPGRRPNISNLTTTPLQVVGQFELFRNPCHHVDFAFGADSTRAVLVIFAGPQFLLKLTNLKTPL